MTKKSGKSFARRLGVDEGADYEERKMIILREAAKLLVEKGLQKTSIDELAERLEVTKPTIYHYLKGKDEIIAEVLRIGSKQLGWLIEKLDKSELSGLEKLRELFRLYSMQMADDFGRCVILVDVKALSPQSLSLYTESRKQFVGAIRGIIEQGIRDGSIRQQDPTITAFAIIGSFNFIAQWYRPGGEYGINEVYERFLDIFEAGLKASA